MTAPEVKRKKVELLLASAEPPPTLPGVLQRVLPLVMVDQPQVRDLQQSIECDLALTARVVRLATRLGQPAEAMTSIDAVLEAVPVEMLAADLLSTSAVDPETVESCQLERLWRHSLAVGIAAQVIASRMGTVSTDAALLAGILHDIGQAVLAVRLPKAYSQVLDRVQTSGGDILEAERQVFGVDHTVLGRHLAQQWGLAESLQNVLWLHHQTHVGLPQGSRAAPLAQVVHLADLLAKQSGLAYCPAEEVRENTAEVAERLSLSGGHAEQIAHQLATGVELNAGPVGMLDRPTPGALYDLIAAANARLGHLYTTALEEERVAEGQARRADLMIRLNARLASCQRPREVLKAVAQVAREALGLRMAAPYLVGASGGYVEGVLLGGSAGAEEAFLYEVTEHEGLDGLLPASAGRVAAAGLARAEVAEGWLFERLGGRLGPGPFYTVPMIVDEKKVGGLVFAPDAPSRRWSAQETGELLTLANVAGGALQRAQAEASLVGLSEELAEVTRELQLAHEDNLQQQNVASLSEMAAGAAHEINNPLAIISGRAQQLAADEPRPERREMLQTIVRQASRISDILAELREFARPAAPQVQPVDPTAMATRVAAEFQAGLTPPHPALRVQAPANCPAICVDAEQVAAALGEILQNAVDACDAANAITLSVQPLADGTAVRFAVTDDGPGMDPQVRARALDPFYSATEAGRRRGLGLPKAYRVVQANGGQMALESAPGKGTTVRMTFHAAGDPAAADRQLVTNGSADRKGTSR
jgi:putative nucleotidyltransferase with HDIG domain